MSEPLRNWAGNVEFRAARVHRPASLEELRRAVAGASRVRTLGTGHSFNRLADTEHDLVLTGELPHEVEIDSEARTAVVAGGMRLADIAEKLDAAGFALANMPSLPHISLAGAVATGTHGSGDRNPGMGAMVRAVRLVGPEGDVVEFDRDEAPDFAGTVVSLGALGVVTHLTVDLRPTFEIAQRVYQDVDLGRLIEDRTAVFAAGYSVSAFTDWGSGKCAVWLKSQVDGEDGGDSGSEVPGAGWLGGHPATEPVHPVPGMPAENCTRQLDVAGPWYRRLPHFRPEFTPSSGEELQSEFFVTWERAGEALEAVRQLGSRIAPVVQISEIRTIAADRLWLSPSYCRDSMAIHFTWIADRAAVEPVLAEVESALMPLGARPHWGKVFLGGGEAAIAGYERAGDFEKLLGRLDPAGKFRNAYIDGLFPRG
jgi:alditol oxidase